MTIEIEILINKYGQGVVDLDNLLTTFTQIDEKSREHFLKKIIFLIVQSKPENNDIELAIQNSGLKKTYTPCVLLSKGIQQNNLEKIKNLPNTEYKKVFILFMNLFKIAYGRRLELEKNDPNKWWYWDLSDNRIVDKILDMDHSV